MVLKEPCGGIGCDCLIEITCYKCGSSIDLLEKVGTIRYIECHTCKKVYSFSDNDYAKPEDFPRTKRSIYD